MSASTAASQGTHRLVQQPSKERVGPARGPLGRGPHLLHQRIFGPDHRRHLRAELQHPAKDQRNDSATNADQEYRQTIQRRFAELTVTRRAKQAELDQIKIDAPPSCDDADLLDQIPQLQADMAELPRKPRTPALWRLSPERPLQPSPSRSHHQVMIREDTIMTLTEATQDDRPEIVIGALSSTFNGRLSFAWYEVGVKQAR